MLASGAHVRIPLLLITQAKKRSTPYNSKMLPK